MRMLKVLAAVAAIGLITPFALAQDTKKDTNKDPKEERKTESKKDAEGEGKESKTKFDRGDEKAEKFLKRAYIRVYSAEAAGLKKLHAGADIGVDASAFGMGEMPFGGEIWWKTGGAAIWESTDEDTGSSPLGNISALAKGLFEPYLAYVTGFESWDVRFKQASFAFGDPIMEGEGDKAKEVAKTVVVKYADDKRAEETFAIAENKVLSVSKDADVQGQKARVTFSFEYEDKGDKLRITSITGSTEVDMSGLPGQEPDPKNPVPKGASKEKLEGTIKVTKYGKVGEFEVALELEGSMSLMGMSFPATMKLDEAKINDDVKDEDFPEGAKEESSDDEF